MFPERSDSHYHSFGDPLVTRSFTIVAPVLVFVNDAVAAKHHAGFQKTDEF